jgi:hypothetical protein
VRVLLLVIKVCGMAILRGCAGGGAVSGQHAGPRPAAPAAGPRPVAGSSSPRLPTPLVGPAAVPSRGSLRRQQRVPACSSCTPSPPPPRTRTRAPAASAGQGREGAGQGCSLTRKVS